MNDGPKKPRPDNDHRQPLRPDRFGFELVEDEDLDEGASEGLDLSRRLTNFILAIFLLGLIGFLGFTAYEKVKGPIADFLNKPDLPPPPPPVEVVIEEPPAPAETQAPPAKVRPLFNPDGTMKAPFPLPPDGPPEDTYDPDQEVIPPLPENRGGGGRSGGDRDFDPDMEAFDPSQSRYLRQRSPQNQPAAKPARPKNIGAYEVFDPEASANERGGWEQFEDPRR